MGAGDERQLVPGGGEANVGGAIVVQGAVLQVADQGSAGDVAGLGEDALELDAFFSGAKCARCGMGPGGWERETAGYNIC